MQLRNVMLCLWFALFSVASASSPEACNVQGTCDAAKGSAMLQVKRGEAPTVNVVNQSAGLLDVDSQRSCISQSLRMANHKARANKSEECKAPDSEGKMCKNHGMDGKCALPVDHTDISHTGGDPREHMFCDVGQYSACKAWQHSAMGESAWTRPADDTCEVGGLEGKCKNSKETGAVSGYQRYYECVDLEKPEEPKPEALPNSLKSPAAKGAKELAVVSNRGFYVGQDIVIDPGTAIEEHNKIVGFGSLILASPLQYDHGAGVVVIPASSLGSGSTASLDAAGFKAVTSLCCPMETEAFFNRVLDQQGYDVCSKPHIQGLMHWFTCVPDMDFQYMLDVIANGNPCKYWASKGTDCPALTPYCQGEWCR